MFSCPCGRGTQPLAIGTGFVSVSMAPAGRDAACEDPHADSGVRPSTTRSRLGGCCSSRPASAASRRVVVWVRRASRRGFCKRLWRVSSASTQACNASDIMKHRYPAVLATEVRLRIPAKDFDALAPVPLGVPLADEIVDRRPGRAPAAPEAFNVHRRRPRRSGPRRAATTRTTRGGRSPRRPRPPRRACSPSVRAGSGCCRCARSGGCARARWPVPARSTFSTTSKEAMSLEFQRRTRAGPGSASGRPRAAPREAEGSVRVRAIWGSSCP